ncbi:MAG: undecaprenyl-diphosphate phosphatase [Gammaproteobacteria bacterium]
MDFLHALLLGLIQGLTEFLPISSSAHLILLPQLTHWQDQGRAVDVAAHAGSLLAVLHYFRRDVLQLTKGWCDSFTRPVSQQGRLAWYLLIATLPMVIAGVAIAVLLDPNLRHPLIIATATIAFALLLWWADVTGKRQRGIQDIHLRDAIIIGIMQTLALIPGTSRAGITITAGLLLGLDRNTASRFAFLLAIPAIMMAAAYELSHLVNEQAQTDWLQLCVVILVSFTSALLAIHYFLKLLNKIAMLPYVIYRLLLGMLLLVVFI